MKRILLPALLFATALSGTAQAASIFEAMEMAYENNPTLQAERAYLRSLDENVAIANSGYRPTIALTGSYNDSNSNNNSEPGVVDESGVTKNIAATINQPLFNGFSTVNSVRSADSAVRAAQDNLMDVEQSTLLSAATAYLNVLQNAAIVDLQKNNEKLLKKELDETLERFKVGEVTRTDVSQARARHANAMAERISSEGDLEASQAEYVRIVGQKADKLTEPENISNFLPKTFREAYEQAKNGNYAVSEARHTLDAQSYDVAAKTGALLPSLSLNGSASRTKTDPDSAIGKATINDVEWGVNLTVPLYSAGSDRAQIRQSKYLKWQAQEKVLEAERQVRYDIKSAWEYVNSNRARIESIKEQVKANEVALDGVQKEEALGNRTILDVLNAYQELLNSNVEEVKAKRDYYVSSLQLLMGMGKLTAKDLKLNVDIYDAKKHYKETRGKWLSLSVDK